MTEFLTTYGLWLVIALLIVIAITYLMSSKATADKTSADKAQDSAGAQQPPTSQADIAPPPVTVTATPVPPVIDPIPAATPEQSVAIDISPASPAPAATVSPEGPDNLLQLKGVGPKLAILLNTLGITRFAQIAAWTDADIAAIDAKLGNFKGRPVRDQWIDQAKYLASGDVAGFEAKYGKL